MSAHKDLPKVLVFDFDDTIFDSQEQRMIESTEHALDMLTLKSFHLILATGRNYQNLEKTGVCTRFKWHGYCLNNGQIVMNSHQETIRHHFLNEDLVLRTIALAQQEHLSLLLSSPKGDVLLGSNNSFVHQAHNYFREPIPTSGKYDKQPIDKILIYAPLTYDYHLFKAIPGLSILHTGSTSANISRSDISKYSGISELCDYLGVELRYTAFGDSLNDLEMIKHADIGVVVGEGHPELLTYAHYQTKALKEDGLAIILRELGYL